MFNNSYYYKNQLVKVSVWIEFVAKTTVTKFCSTNCGRKAYKKRKRDEKIDQVKEEVSNKIKEIANEVVDKEIISVKEVDLRFSHINANGSSIFV